MKELFYETVSGEMKPTKPKRINPLLKVYGNGPDGKKCIECTHQFFHEFSKRYSKCELRKITGSPKSDHSSKFPACGKFEPKPQVLKDEGKLGNVKK